jgi:hypothetical protein
MLLIYLADIHPILLLNSNVVYIYISNYSNHERQNEALDFIVSLSEERTHSHVPLLSS